MPTRQTTDVAAVLDQAGRVSVVRAKMLKRSFSTKTTASCNHCGKEIVLISKSIGLCLHCIRHDSKKVSPVHLLRNEAE
ncbi:MAG: hypothetical protein A2Z36_03015 [Chloroflexi bacterium RBG_19FT_COMBO_48_23]|nr:MAG: hypothetical protein A2Z36_03015 [Chloroflexi bacterium RBG_19FT_COMBO_48_23]